MNLNVKIITLILLGVIFSPSIYSQGSEDMAGPEMTLEKDYQKFRFGIFASPSVSWLKPQVNQIEKLSNRMGFSYGIASEFAFSANYAFATGLQLTSIGGELEYADQYTSNAGIAYAGTKRRKYNLKYVEIPMAIKMKTNEIGWIAYYAKFGFNANVLYKSSGDDIILPGSAAKLAGLESNLTENDADISKDVNFMNVALAIGGGIEYNISGNTHIVVGATFSNGFMNILSNDLYETDNNKETIIVSNKAVESDKKAKAIANYISLDVGVFF